MAATSRQWMFPTWARGMIAVGGGAICIVLIASRALPPFLSYTVALACVYAVIVMSVSLLAGWGGVWSIGQPAMVAIGAYTTAFGSAHGWSIEVTILVAMVLAAICGAFLGFAGSRFSILYIALLTLAFNLVVLEIIEHWTDVTGGDQGVPVGVLPSITGLFEIGAGGETAEFFVIGSLVVVILGALWLRRASGRRQLTAVKTHPLAARSVGISVEGRITVAFAMSAALAGFGGVLYALLGGYVSAESASLDFGINLIAGTVVGGTGSIVGAIIGGTFMAASPSVANAVGVDQAILQGAVLILALLLLRGGVVTPVAALTRRLLGVAHQDTVRRGAVSGVAPVTGAGGRLDVEGLGVRFGGLKALDGVTFEARPAEVVCIIGPNGAGKTTLMNALSGLLPPRSVSGSISYADRPLPSGHAAARSRRGIARTFQHAELFDELTVLQNVVSGARRMGRADWGRAWALLDRLDLSDVANMFPRQLPFGTRKRVDLVRALFHEPSILLMDEPFGGLDDHERRVMAATIVRLRDEGLTLLVIDHVLDDLRAVADRFIAFDFGTVLTSGPPESVLGDSAVRAAYLGIDESALGEPSPPRGTTVSHVIALEHVSFRYGSIGAVDDVSVVVPTGRITAIVGANGAGKSTMGRLLAGVSIPSAGRRVAENSLRISLVPEGRGLFRSLSVAENLEVSAYAAGLSRRQIADELDRWRDWLPERARTRMGAPAAALSGGEQQMVAIARALMARPDVLILDEPALGLAPTLVDEVYERIEQLAADGLTVVILEQLLSRAVDTADQVVVMRDGRVHLVGNRAMVDFADDAERAYFGHVVTVT